MNDEHLAEVIRFPAAATSPDALRAAIRAIEQRDASQASSNDARITAFPGASADSGLRDEAETALVKALARAPKSAQEARELLERDFPDLGDFDRDHILGRMHELGYLDDARLAAQLRDGSFARKRLSRTSMSRELRARGISSDIIEQELSAIDRDDEFELALELARERLRRTAGLDPDTAYRRIHAFLARRGFGGELASRAIREALGE